MADEKVPLPRKLSFSPSNPMIYLPLIIVRLMPRSWAFAYAKRLKDALGRAEQRGVATETLLGEISPDFEYTMGFRGYLERKVEEAEMEWLALAEYLGEVELIMDFDVDLWNP